MKTFVFYAKKCVSDYCCTFYFILAAIMMMSISSYGQAITGVVPVQTPLGGSGVDGDALAHTPATIPGYVGSTTDVGDLFDMVHPTGTHGVLDLTTGNLLYPGFTYFLQDPYVDDKTIFTLSNKINDNPNTYTWGPGSSPNKNEIQNCGAHFSYGEPSLGGLSTDLWCLFAGDRQVTNGSSYIDFEFLQKSLTITGAEFGTFNPQTGTTPITGGSGSFLSLGTDGGRTVGDLLVTIEFVQGGGAASISIRKWEAVGAGFEYVIHPNSEFIGEVFITNNTSPTSVPFDVYGTNPGTYVVNQWAEGAVNLTQLFAQDPCFVISTLFIRTRSSGNSDQSELKDFPGAPIQLQLNFIPDAPTVTSATICEPGIVNLSAGGCPGGTLKWYDAATLGNLVNTGPTYSPNITSTTSFWVSCTNSRGCEGPRTQVTGTINNVVPGTIAGDQTLCTPFNPAEFTSTTPGSGSGTITYQWQMSTTGCGSGFADIVGATSATYDAGAVAVITYFRRVTTSTLNGVPCSANSNCLTVTPNAINPGVVAGSQTLCTPFNPVAFTSTTPGSGGGAITYQWQMSTTGCGSGFADIVGATSATYDAPAVAVVTYFRRVATSTLNGVPCSDNSNCLTVTPNDITPGVIAGNQTICSGGNPAAFTSTTPGSTTGGGTISYQWQSGEGTCATATFANIVGATSATYDVPAGLSVTTSYRRVATSTLNDVPCSDNSNCITVTIINVTPGTIAASQTICSGGNPAAFTETVPAGGSNLTYQWQSGLGTCATATFSDIVGATSATYDPPTGLMATTSYRRVVNSTDAECPAISNCLTVTVNDISPGVIAGSQTLCTPFNPVAFTSTTPGSGGGTITYQWQISTTGCGSGFADIVGATSATYDAPAVAVVTYFRRVAISTLNGTPCSDNSNCLTVTPNAINPGVIAGSQTLCAPFDPMAFTSTTPGSGDGAITYQWQMSTTGCESGFSDIVGATSATYDAPAVAVVTYFRRVATSTLNGVPCSDNSNCLTVTPESINPGEIAGSQTLCAPFNPVAFTSVTPGSNGGVITYQWQMSTTNCDSGFTDIVGATSATYDAPAVTVTTYFRRVATSTLNGTPCYDNSNCLTVTASPSPILMITNPQSVCSPLTVDLTAAAVTAGSTLYGATLSYWQDPAATIALANPNAVAMSGTYYIKATTTDGCFDIEPVTVLIESCDQEGCTLGYWKNHTDRWCPAYTPSMLFGSVFVNAPSSLANLTLLQALNLGGGNIYNLARQGVAALLNACSDEVDYPAPYGDNPQLVIDAVNAAYASYTASGGKAPGRLATQLDILNNSGCPLGGTPATIVNPSAGAEEADFTMSPVPFREEITIRYNFDYKTDATIQILDASGNLIMTYDDRDAYFNKEVTLNPNLNHRDVQLLFVKVITNKGFTVKKIISTK